jgi:hypothetical protein
VARTCTTQSGFSSSGMSGSGGRSSGAGASKVLMGNTHSMPCTTTAGAQGLHVRV